MASIQKRTRRKGTVYRVRYRNPEGQQRSKSFESWDEARKFRTAVESEKDQGQYVDPWAGETTLREWTEHYLEALQVKPSTLQKYESTIRFRILPALGERALKSIRPIDVQKYIANLDCSNNQVHECYKMLNRLLKLAVESELIGRNPVKGVSLPRLKHSERSYLTAEEVEEIAEAAGHYKSFIYFLAYTGCRFGEAVALTYEQINGNRITIDRQTTFVSGQAIHTTPKGNRPRVISMAPFLKDMLGEGSGLVFRTVTGKPIRNSNWHHMIWKPLITELGYDLRTHDLRHTAGALMVRAGLHPKLIQEQLGHADIQTTMNIYTHIHDDQRDEVGNALDTLFKQ